MLYLAGCSTFLKIVPKNNVMTFVKKLESARVFAWKETNKQEQFNLIVQMFDENYKTAIKRFFTIKLNVFTRA